MERIIHESSWFSNWSTQLLHVLSGHNRYSQWLKIFIGTNKYTRGVTKSFGSYCSNISKLWKSIKVFVSTGHCVHWFEYFVGSYSQIYQWKETKMPFQGPRVLKVGYILLRSSISCWIWLVGLNWGMGAYLEWMMWSCVNSEIRVLCI